MTGSVERGAVTVGETPVAGSRVVGFPHYDHPYSLHRGRGPPGGRPLRLEKSRTAGGGLCRRNFPSHM
jgi:hypothetical protein